jgi:hypothetical protein
MIHETGRAGVDAAFPGDGGNGFKFAEIRFDDTRVDGVVADGVKAPLNRCGTEPMAQLPQLIEPLLEVRYTRL